MYTQLYIINVEFEWDEVKNLRNIVKHGIDFNDAAEIFSKPVIVRQDLRKSYGEARWNAVGTSQGRVVSVTYTFRYPRIRIISIRRANRDERKAHEEEN